MVIPNWDNFGAVRACMKTKEANKGDKLKRICLICLDPKDKTNYCFTFFLQYPLPVKFWLITFLPDSSLDNGKEKNE